MLSWSAPLESSVTIRVGLPAPFTLSTYSAQPEEEPDELTKLIDKRLETAKAAVEQATKSGGDFSSKPGEEYLLAAVGALLDFVSSTAVCQATILLTKNIGR
jgi:hypothetical protein